MKNVLKSVRLSDKVYDYINLYKGNGFNEKFENIILFSMESEKQLLDRVSELEKQIGKKQKELTQLTKKFTVLQALNLKFSKLEEVMTNLLDEISDIDKKA